MKSFFISSTFKDMQAERDVLHQEVFPALRRRLKEYGEDVQELDLRWGVDTSRMSEEDSGKHVIESCIDAIDRCKPYMVVLVGERYGWIPDRALIEQSHDARLEMWCQEEISITQMEILYGAMKEENLKQCIFCFRDSSFNATVPEEYRALYEVESEKHRTKLEALKEKILANPKAHIMEYHPVWDDEAGQAGNLKEFRDGLENALWEMLKSQFGEQKQTMEERILQDAVLTSSMYLRSYVARQKEQEKGAALLNGRSGGWITGESGSGKSAYMASIAASARKIGVHVFLYYCGNENCGKTEVLLDTLLYWLKMEFPQAGSEIPDTNGLTRRQKLFYIDRALRSERDADRLILIDAVDEMEEDISEILMILADAVIREKVEGHTFAIGVSSLPEYYEMRSERLSEYFGARPMEPFRNTEINAFVQIHAAHRGKHVDAKVVAEIRKKRGCTNPYYLSLVMQKLFMMSKADFEEAERLAPGMEGISRFMRKEIEVMPEEVSALTISMLEEAAEKLRLMYEGVESVNEQADPMEIIKLLAVSEGGLKLAEIEAMIGREGRIFLPVFLERFFCYLYDSFGEDREGRWDFRHRMLRESLLQIMSRDEICRFAKMLCVQKLENKELDQAFFYAIRARDILRLNQCITGILKDQTFDKRVLILECYKLLTQDGQRVFAEVLESPELEKDAYIELLSKILLSDTDMIWRETGLWQGFYGTFAKAEPLSAAARFWQRLSGLVFLNYGMDSEQYLQKWHEMVQAFDAIECPGKEEIDAYYCNLLEVMQDSSRKSLWEELKKRYIRLEFSIKKLGLDKKEYEIDEMQCVLFFWEKLKESKEEDQSSNLGALQTLLNINMNRLEREGLEKLSPIRIKVYETLRGQQVILVRRYLKLKRYQEVVELTKQLMSYYELRMKLLPSLAEGMQYANVLGCRSQAVKINFKEKYKEQELKIWTRLDTMYESEVVRDFLAYTNYSLGKILEDIERYPEIERGYDHAERIVFYYTQAIELYDGLLKDRTAEDSNYSYLLSWALYARHMRVARRVRRDIWFWKEEKWAYRFKEPEFFENQMEDDLRRLEAGCYELYEPEGKNALNRELRRVYRIGALYYDMHQEEEKAIIWCGKLTECQSELLEELTYGGCWAAVSYYMDALEIYLRWDRWQKVIENAGVCLQILRQISNEWIEENKLREEWRRTSANLYLMLAQIYLQEKQEQQVITCCKSAQEMIAAQEGRWEELPETDAMVRERYMGIVGRLYHALGDDARSAQILKSARDSWNEEKQSALVLKQSSGNLDVSDSWAGNQRYEKVMQRYFEMLKMQELRAKITDDQKLLLEVIHEYHLILENYTTDQNASRRPLLLRQAQALAEYYQAKAWAIPEELEDILLVNEEARDSRRMQYLEEQEETLRTEFQGMCKDEMVSGKELMDKLQELSDTLYDRIQIMKKAKEESQEIRKLRETNLSYVRCCSKVLWKKGENRRAESLGNYVLTALCQMNEDVPDTYVSEEQWEFYVLLREKRETLPSLGESGETDWMSIMGHCADLCLRALKVTGEVLWLERLLSETRTYREYMAKRIHENPSRAEWTREKAWETYDYDQETYLLAGKKGILPIEQWLLPYLESVRVQYETRGTLVRDSYYMKRLEVFYELQDETEGYDEEIQKMIDLFSHRQMRDDQDFSYYMMKAVRDLDGEEDINVIMAYIEKLKQESQSI